MKSYDYEAVVYDGEEYCVARLPSGVSVESEDVSPIFGDQSRERPAICAECEFEHDCMPLSPKPNFYRFEMREGDDGDAHFWSVQFRSSDPCLVQDAPEDCECGSDHREFFANFRSMGEEDTEPERATSIYRCWEGEWAAA